MPEHATKEKILMLFDDMDMVIRHLLDSLNGNEEKSTIKHLVQLAADTDKDIQVSLRDVQAHLEMQVKIDRLRVEIDRADKYIYNFQRCLRDIETSLRTALYYTRQRLTSLETASKNRVLSEEITRLGHKISASHGVEAPDGWTPSNPLRPYPTGDEIAKGYLGIAVTKGDFLSKALEHSKMNTAETPFHSHALTSTPLPHPGLAVGGQAASLGPGGVGAMMPGGPAGLGAHPQSYGGHQHHQHHHHSHHHHLQVGQPVPHHQHHTQQSPHHQHHHPQQQQPSPHQQMAYSNPQMASMSSSSPYGHHPPPTQAQSPHGMHPPPPHHAMSGHGFQPASPHHHGPPPHMGGYPGLSPQQQQQHQQQQQAHQQQRYAQMAAAGRLAGGWGAAGHHVGPPQGSPQFLAAGQPQQQQHGPPPPPYPYTSAPMNMIPPPPPPMQQQTHVMRSSTPTGGQGLMHQGMQAPAPGHLQQTHPQHSYASSAQHRMQPPPPHFSVAVSMHGGGGSGGGFQSATSSTGGSTTSSGPSMHSAAPPPPPPPVVIKTEEENEPMSTESSSSSSSDE